MALKQNTTIVFPDKVRQAVTTPLGNQTVVINGEGGFMAMGEKVQPLPAAVLQEQTKEQGRNLIYLLHYYDDPALEVLAAGEEKVEGTDCQILATSFKGVESRLWVAPDGKVLKQTYQGVNPITRTPGMIENVYTDYRPQGELLFARQAARRIDGEELMTITIESLEVNPKVDLNLFKKPAE